MIVTLCSDKGSPGVTTLAVALGLVWPVQRLVLEADPAGGDLAFRMRQPGGGGPLGPDPSAGLPHPERQVTARRVGLQHQPLHRPHQAQCHRQGGHPRGPLVRAQGDDHDRTAITATRPVVTWRSGCGTPTAGDP